MENKYNVWCKWHPLKTVMLGSCYPVSFFRKIKNDRIRSALEKITHETIEDLEYYDKVLKDFGCKVIRPVLDPNQDIMSVTGSKGQVKNLVPRSPLQTRDNQLVVGDRLLMLGKDHPGIKDGLMLYNDRDVDIIDDSELPAPCVTMIGKDIYVDGHFVKPTDTDLEIMRKYHPFRINTINIGGHNDGCFHTLKPGVILTLENIQKYENTFPNWDVCILPDQSWALVEGFMMMKKKVKGKWWIPGEEDNNELIDFVETWLKDWVGYVEETVFDVNVLMLDDRHVCVNNYNKIAFDFFKKHHIEPIIVPLRHRYFWDGGLHCITLDLYREGETEDYFPERTGPVTDPGFD